MTVTDPLELIFARAHGHPVELVCRYTGPSEGRLDHANTEECLACGAADCPGKEALHYHHDGCPYCYFQECRVHATRD